LSQERRRRWKEFQKSLAHGLVDLFENVVEAGSTIVVWLSSLPGFPADNQVKIIYELCADVFKV